MKLFGAILTGAALAVVPALVAVPAHAQDVLGQVQRFFGPPSDEGHNNNQDAYQRGRLDEQRRLQAQQQERWREQHAENHDRYPDQRGYNNNNDRRSDQGYYGGQYPNGYSERR